MNEQAQYKIEALELTIKNLECKIEHMYRHLYQMICELDTSLQQGIDRYEMNYPQKDFDDD